MGGSGWGRWHLPPPGSSGLWLRVLLNCMCRALRTGRPGLQASAFPCQPVLRRRLHLVGPLGLQTHFTVRVGLGPPGWALCYLRKESALPQECTISQEFVGLYLPDPEGSRRENSCIKATFLVEPPFLAKRGAPPPPTPVAQALCTVPGGGGGRYRHQEKASTQLLLPRPSRRCPARRVPVWGAWFSLGVATRRSKKCCTRFRNGPASSVPQPTRTRMFSVLEVPVGEPLWAWPPTQESCGCQACRVPADTD